MDIELEGRLKALEIALNAVIATLETEPQFSMKIVLLNARARIAEKMEPSELKESVLDWYDHNFMPKDDQPGY